MASRPGRIEREAKIGMDNREKKRLVSLVLAVALLAGGAAGALSTVVLKSPSPRPLADSGPASKKIVLEESSAVIDTVKKVSPSVVSITASTNTLDFFTGQAVEQKGGGTGFVLTSDGLIVTNKHVVDQPNTKYTVITAEGKNYLATVLSRDSFNDLAVIKVDAKGLKPVELGDSDALQIGQWVVAIGNALGEFQNTVTIGVVSAKERQIKTTNEALNGLIQTDAAINPGNSGGPLVNLAGQVVGINTAIAGNAEGIGFAINIDSIKTALDSVERTGKIVRPYLGVRYLNLNTEIARSAGLSVEQGALVYRGPNPTDFAVAPGSPADKAGIAENDIITKINGQELNENTSLVSLLQKYKPGETVTLTVIHKGEEKKIDVVLDEQK